MIKVLLATKGTIQTLKAVKKKEAIQANMKATIQIVTKVTIQIVMKVIIQIVREKILSVVTVRLNNPARPNYKLGQAKVQLLFRMQVFQVEVQAKNLW